MKLRNATYLLASSVLAVPAFAHAAEPQATPAQTAPADAAAATDTTEIIVTAQKRSENLRDVPITITALGSDTLAKTNVTSVQGLATLVSGFTGPGDLAFTSPHLRGVGSQIGGPGLETSVATYVDGVYIGAPSPALLKFAPDDIAQIEVLKGPQGTLFGRNTTGGLVQIQTRDPGRDFNAQVEVGYGNFETYNGNAYVNVPISANVSTNLAVSDTGAGKGWGTNYTLARTGPSTFALSTNGATPSYKLNSDVNLRNKWKIDLDSSTTLMLIGDYEHHDDDGFFNYRPVQGNLVNIGTANGYVSTVGGWDTASPQTHTTSDAWGLTARFSHEFDFATLTNTLAYRNTKFDILGFTGSRLATPLNTNDFFWYTSNHQWSDELQLSSRGSGPLHWTTGLFLYEATDSSYQPEQTGDLPFTPTDGAIPFASATTTRSITKSIAGYGQVDYKLGSGTTLTAGLRYSDDYHKQTGQFQIFSDNTLSFPVVSQTEDAPSFSKGALSGRVSITQKFSNDAMIYASYNRGTKSGGFNPVHIGTTTGTGAATDTNGDPYLDEKLNAYEVGTKLRLLNRMLDVNLSGFYYSYSNIQIQAFYGGPPVIYNGPSAKLYGLDADAQFRPTTNLTLTGSLELMHSEFGYFPTAQYYTAVPVTGGYTAGTANVQGNSLPLAPNGTASFIANYSIPTGFGTFDLNGNYKYTSSYYFSVGHEFGQQATAMLGASIQFTSVDKRFYARVWGNNLTNRQQIGSGSVSTSDAVVTLNAPRTYGVTFGVKWN